MTYLRCLSEHVYAQIGIIVCRKVPFASVGTQTGGHGLAVISGLCYLVQTPALAVDKFVRNLQSRRVHEDIASSHHEVDVPFRVH